MRVAPLIEHGAAHAVVEAICDAVESRGRTAADRGCRRARRADRVPAHGRRAARIGNARREQGVHRRAARAARPACWARRCARKARTSPTTAIRATWASAAGLPVRIDGVVAGAVAVSGLSDDEDEALAGMGVAMLQGDLPPTLSV
jgi:hypothetical protein